MLGQDAELVLARKFRMLGDDGPPVKDREAAGAAQDLDRLADERERHRIAIGLEADEIILGHDARLPVALRVSSPGASARLPVPLLRAHAARSSSQPPFFEVRQHARRLYAAVTDAAAANLRYDHGHIAGRGTGIRRRRAG